MVRKILNPRRTVEARPVVKKDRKVVDKRVSVCTDCSRGIFADHDYIWTSRGLVHTSCNKRTNETNNAA
ncbi:MAG: hypothetical protein HMLIMOIP_002054 [Candidatus Nitrosomirales archaeon]|jgi:hypothetical protein